MRRRIYAVSLAVVLCSGAAYAQTQQAQTDYQRAMNAVNNASSAAYGQPQPDPGAIDSSGDPTPNGDTTTATGGTNTSNGNIPLANQNASTYGRPMVGPTGYGQMGSTTTTGAVGLGAYNSSPYNTAPTTGGNPYGGSGRGATTPSFTGQ